MALAPEIVHTEHYPQPSAAKLPDLIDGKLLLRCLVHLFFGGKLSAAVFWRQR